MTRYYVIEIQGERSGRTTVTTSRSRAKRLFAGLPGVVLLAFENPDAETNALLFKRLRR